MADEGETVVASILGYLRMDDSPWSATIDRAKAKARELNTVNPNIAIRTNAELAIAQLRAVKAAETDLAQNSRLVVRATKDVENAQASAAKATERLKAAQDALAALDVRGGGTEKQQESALKRVYAAEAAVLAVAGRLADAQGRVSTATAGVERAQVRVNARLAEAKRLAAEAPQLVIRTNAAQFLADSAKMRADILTTGVAFERAKDDAERALHGLDQAMNSSGHSILKTWNTVKDALRAATAAPAGTGGASGGGPGAIFYGIAAGATLAGPALGATTAALAGFVGMAGTAYAVYKGFQQELKDGTPIGLQLEGALQGVGGELSHLEEIAANSASGGVLATLDQLHAAIPGLEPEIATLAAHLGKALNIATPGVISIAKQLGPILNDAGVDAEHLAQNFTTFADSPRFRQFLDYARAELPIVAHDLGDVVKTAVDLGVALQPVGDKFLKDIDQTATAVDKLTGPLTTLTRATESGPLEKLDKVLDFTNPISRTVTMLNLGSKAAKVSAQTQAQQAQAAIQQSIAQNQANVALSAGYDQAVALATANQSAASAIEQEKTASAAATEQMKLQNDAAGLLTSALDKLNGGNLSAAQAQNQFDQDLVNMAKHVHGADAALVGMSSSAIKNRGDLITLATGAAQAAEKYGAMTDANGKLIHGSEDSRQKLIALRKQLIDNAVGWGENRAQVTALVDSILKIPPKATTHGVLDTTEAEDRLAAYRAKLASLAGMTPVTTIRARVDGALASIRSVVEYAANHPAIIHVVTGTQTGFIGGGRQVAEGHATGGDIHGPGTGTSDSVRAVNTSTGQPIALSNGEEVQTADSNRRNHAALDAANHGATLAVVKRYATGGDIVSLTPSKPSTSSSSRSKSKAGKKAKQVVVPLVVTAGGGQAYGVASYISSQRSAAVRAMRAMRDLSAAVNDAFQLKGIQAKLAAARADLVAARSAAADLTSTVIGAAQGGINPAQYGDVTDLTGTYQNRAATVTQFSRQIAKLSKEGLTKSLLAQYAAAGPSAGLDALAAAAPTQVAQLNKAYAGYVSASGTAGHVASQDVFGARIAADQRAVSQYTAQSARTEQAMLRTLAALGQMLSRPAKVVADGKEFAHLVIESNEFQGVFDDLTHAITYGRRP